MNKSLPERIKLKKQRTKSNAVHFTFIDHFVGLESAENPLKETEIKQRKTN